MIVRTISLFRSLVSYFLLEHPYYIESEFTWNLFADGFLLHLLSCSGAEQVSKMNFVIIRATSGDVLRSFHGSAGLSIFKVKENTCHIQH